MSQSDIALIFISLVFAAGLMVAYGIRKRILRDKAIIAAGKELDKLRSDLMEKEESLKKLIKENPQDSRISFLRLYIEDRFNKYNETISVYNELVDRTNQSRRKETQ
jgi:hypothetical protein